MDILLQNIKCAVTPIDGRYSSKVDILKTYLSEEALILYRVKVELLWLEFLLEKIKTKDISTEVLNMDDHLDKLRILIKQENIQCIDKIKSIEKKTKHDVKAVEYYLRDLLIQEGFDSSVVALIHFACTSEDINNLSYALMLKDLRQKVLIPSLNELIDQLLDLTEKSSSYAMLSRTHGQAASPTTLGKEIGVFAYRLFEQSKDLKKIKIIGKINGAVGNYNAHHFVFSDSNWPRLSQDFVEKKLDLAWNPFTTQIENHDWVAKFCDQVAQISNICLDLSRDTWGYISFDYLTQIKTQGEVGSSTMPHKVNPIDFENAEGNFGIAVSLCRHLSNKLPISRFQRDLSDSTVFRSLGTLFAYYSIAINSLLQGIKKVEANPEKMSFELNSHWELLAEPIQMLLRRYGVVDAYEKLKDFSRGEHLTRSDIHSLVDSFENIPKFQKEKLKELSPQKYIGYAEKLAKEIVELVLKSKKNSDL